MKGQIVYEDESTEAVMPMDPKAAGQIVIKPKVDSQNIEDIDPEMVTHYFYVASKAAIALFEGLGAEGTNIIMNEGIGRPFSITVLPRKKDDGLEFNWEPKKIPENVMKDVQQKISWEFLPPKNTHVVSQDELDQKSRQVDKKEEDQLLKWYRKTP